MSNTHLPNSNVLKPMRSPTKSGAQKSAFESKVGVIEIGSRSVRCLVADVSSDGGLVPIFTRAADISLLKASSAGVRQRDLDALFTCVETFRARAESMNVQKLRVFGTEALRRLVATGEIGEAFRTRGIEILEQRTEAICSFIAGIRALPVGFPSNAGVTVIDQGAGSTELAQGNVGPPVTVGKFGSVPIGGNGLVDRLHAHEFNVKAFRDEVTSIVDGAVLVPKTSGDVIIQGTVATKCAWLSVRRGTHESYDARRVQGARISEKNLVDLVAIVEGASAAKWKKLRAIVNPQEPWSDGLDRIVAGAVPLIRILNRLGKSDFVVSANGTRHGMAWLLAGLPVNGV